MIDPVSDLAAVTALAILMKAAEVDIRGITINDLWADIQIGFDHWPTALALVDGVKTESARQDNDEYQHIHHRLTLPNRVALVCIERRSTNAA